MKTYHFSQATKQDCIIIEIVFGPDLKIGYKILLKQILDNLPSLPSLAEKAMAPHSSTLAWKIPWTEEPGWLQSMGSRKVGDD